MRPRAPTVRQASSLLVAIGCRRRVIGTVPGKERDASATTEIAAAFTDADKSPGKLIFNFCKFLAMVFWKVRRDFDVVRTVSETGGVVGATRCVLAY